MNTPISPELSAQIVKDARKYGEECGREISDYYKSDDDLSSAYEAGATAYAPYKERCEELERWKEEAILVMSPLLDYGQSKEAEIPLGASITTTILQRAKQFQQAKKALEDLVADLKKKIKGVGGLLPQVEERRAQAVRNDDWIEEKECYVLLTVWETNVKQWTETVTNIEALLATWKEEKGGSHE